jgi:hypothetical protein
MNIRSSLAPTVRLKFNTVLTRIFGRVERELPVPGIWFHRSASLEELDPNLNGSQGLGLPVLRRNVSNVIHLKMRWFLDQANEQSQGKKNLESSLF